MSHTLENPFQYFPNPERFGNLGLGKLYIGVVDGDPAFEPSDRIQVYLARQNDTDLAIPQPIDLSSGGVPEYNGSPAAIKVNQQYSISILDKNGDQVFYSPKSNEIIDLNAFLEQLYNIFPVNVPNVAALSSITAVSGRMYNLKEYNSGTGYGGGPLIGHIGVITPNNVTTFAGASGTYFKRDSEIVTATQCGAMLGNSENIAPAINNAITAGIGEIYFGDGQYRIDSSIELGDYLTLRFSRGAVLMAGADNVTMFTASTHAYFTSVYGCRADGNGRNNVCFAAVRNMRLQAGWYDCNITDMEFGLYALGGCFGMAIHNFTSYDGCPNPIVVVENGAVISILNANLDNTSGRWAGTGYGIQIQTSGIPNEGVIISGGYAQGFVRGIWDQGRGTQLSGTYFEQCTEADIYAGGAIQCRYSETQHFAEIGPAAFKFRDSDGCTIFNPNMGSGGRTVLYDVNSTNTNCSEFRTGSATSDNTPLGNMDYLQTIAKQKHFAFTVVPKGATTAGSATATAINDGSATRIGDQVFVTMDILYSGHDGTGALLLTGIPPELQPFTPNTPRIGQVVFYNTPAPAGNLHCDFRDSSTDVRIVAVDPVTGNEALLNIPTAAGCRISFSYFI